MANVRSPITIDIERVLGRLVDDARALLPFDSGGILTYDSETGLLAPHVYQKTTDDAPQPHLIKLGEGVIGTVAGTRESVLVNNVSADPRYEAYDTQTHSQLAVPILYQGELLGVFNVESGKRGAFDYHHQRILQSLADHAALAISTVHAEESQLHRYNRLTDSTEKLFLRNEIGRLASSDQPLEALLPQMAERLAHLIDADACAITVWDAV